MKNLLKIKILVLVLTTSYYSSISSAMQTEHRPFKIEDNSHSISHVPPHNGNFHLINLPFSHQNQVMQKMEIPASDDDAEIVLTNDSEKQILIREILKRTPFPDENILTITREENNKIKKFFNEKFETNLLLDHEKDTVKIFWNLFQSFEPKKQTSFLPLLATLGHPNAQFWYAMRLNNDEKEKKFYFLNLAASQGQQEALLELSKIVSEDISYPLLKLASLKGSHAAQLSLVNSISDNSSKHLSEAQIALAKVFKEIGNPYAEDYLNYDASSGDTDSEDY